MEYNDLYDPYNSNNGDLNSDDENTGAKAPKQRIRMPIGAALACAMIVMLVIAALSVAVRYIGERGRLVYGDGTTKTNVQGGVSPTQSAQTGELDGALRPSDSVRYTGGVLEPDEEYAMIKNSMAAVVSIDVMVKNGYSSVRSGSGSGVLISPDGYIVTCNHVVEGADKIYVYLNDGTSSEANLVGTDLINDLAVIRIAGENLPYAVFGASDTLNIGEGVYAIGNALGELSNTYTSGCISGLDRDIKVEGQRMTLLQTDAAINHGNSGGGLFRKSDGSLIGIVNAKSAGSDIEGLGFAIPSKVAMSIVRDLMDYGFVTGRPYLGVSTEDVTLSGYGFFTSYYTYPKIVELEQNGPAQRAELAVGDVILAVDGVSISGTSSLLAAISSHAAGDSVVLTVLRNRTSIDITVVLGVRAAPGA